MFHNNPASRREIFSWAFFDFANSSFTTVVITAVYSRFFVEHIVPKDSGLKDTYWSLAMIIATLIGMVLSPLLGVISDAGALKKAFLLASTLLCSGATAALFFADAGDVWLAMGFVVLASLGFMFSENFCASFLPEIASKENMGRISGLGWGIGYFGGLLSLILVLKIIISSDPQTDEAAYIAENQFAMIATGVFFLAAAMPTFLFVKNRQKPSPDLHTTSFLKIGWHGITSFTRSLANLRKHRTLLQFLIAFSIYMAGLEAVIKFVGIYASAELQFNNADITLMFLLLQLSAAAGAFLFGFMETRLGPKRTVEASLMLWILGVTLIFCLPWLSDMSGFTQKSIFFGISLLAGSGIGATQASSRAIVGLLSGQEESGEIFGYWGFFLKVATILGMSFGVFSDALDSRRLALLVVICFFVLGLILVHRLQLERQEEA